MSLLVNNYRYLDDGRVEVLDAPDHTEELAGGEQCRTKLFASNFAKSLNFKLLPTLASADVYAEADDLKLLADEARVLLDQADDFSAYTGYRPDYVAQIAKNIARAVERARTNGGGVVIW